MKPEFTCKACCKTFVPNYHISKLQTLVFCSKKCKRAFELGGLHSHDALVNTIRDYALDFGDYVTKAQVLQDLRLSSKTLVQYKVKISDINKSCGYQRPTGSVFEANVYKYLQKMLPQVETQATFPDCISPKGYLLRFDFYCKSKKLLIEADGAQHEKGNYRYTTALGERDNAKDSWAKANGYILLRIPYTRRVTEDFVRNHVSWAISSQS